MESLAIAILAVIWPWPFPVGLPERMESYEERLRTISQAIPAVVRSPMEAAAVVEIWRRESRFRLDVHAGWKRGDHGKANCMGSIHPHFPDWATLAGTDLEATIRCARRTIQTLRSGLYLCAAELPETSVRAWQLAFQHYAVGHCAEPSQESKARADHALSLSFLLYTEMAKAKKNSSVVEAAK